MNHYALRSFALATLASATLVAPSAGSWAADAGEGSERRILGTFERVEAQGAFEIDVRAGVSRSLVIVRGDRDERAKVTTDVRDGTLFVGLRSGTNVSGRATKVEIALPNLRGFKNDGLGEVHISGLGGGDVEIENSGAASIVATGRARHEAITLNGTGKIDAAGVAARDVDVDNNGLGVVDVRASGALTMNVNGVGEIRYAGSPSHVESHVNGIGRIEKL